MEIKGVAIKSIAEFVKKYYDERYIEWLDSLPDSSKKIYKEGIFSNFWYPLEEALVIPTEKICDLFYNGDIKKGAWECGRFSADDALNNIYKMYAKVKKPGYVIDRAARIFSSYYRPAKMLPSDQQDNSFIANITEFGLPSEIIEYRIAGWIERALEISGCNKVTISIVRSMARGDTTTEYQINWV